MFFEYAIYRRIHHLIHIDLSMIVMVWLWTAQDKISFYFNGSYFSYELMNRLMNNHCLKVFGLLALNILLYLFWLALGELLIIGNRIALSLYKWDFGLLMSSLLLRTAVLMIEMVSLEALWLPAISMWSWLTAPFKEMSLYSLYILWIPVLDWYLRTIPKVFTWLGLLSKIWLTESIWPWALLVLSCLRRWYQNFDLATTSLGAKSLIAYTLGLGSCSVGNFLPITKYCLIFIWREESAGSWAPFFAILTIN